MIPAHKTESNCSPSPLPRVNGVSHDEKENDFDVPPPIKIETHS